MPRHGQHDNSPGDRRQPYSTAGGPEGRHAETHDVRREQLTNPTGPEAPDDAFEQDLHDPRLDTPPGHTAESFPASEAKAVYSVLPDFHRDDLDQLSILEEGTRLEQGSVYLDLRDRERGPFKALGGESAEPGQFYVAKRDLDHELWNRLVGEHHEPRVDRPVS